MRFRIKDPSKVAKNATAITLVVMLVWGVVSVFFEVRPFWVDEWRIIYNLKFKTVPEIWGKLAFMQQFPRAYLSVLKLFTAQFNYSYFSLRLPSWLIAVATITMVYRLATVLYPAKSYNRFLLVMMLVSCGTFTEYYVQIKQYTMDLFLCVAVLWQLVYLLRCDDEHQVNRWTYVFMCLSFLLAPFFSYTYPVAVAPVYLVVLIQNIVLWKTDRETTEKVWVIVRQWFPLFMCTFSITIFYVFDVSQLTKDKDMHGYWAHLMMEKGFDWTVFFGNIFHLFAQAGSGFLFWWLFGLLGTAAFVLAIFHSSRAVSRLKVSRDQSLLLYSVLLLLVIVVLYAAGKLPVGEPRLNAFAIPALSIMLIFLLDQMNAGWRGRVSPVLSFILLAGLMGNIYSTIYASFADEKYSQRMAIYNATQTALHTAQSQHLPVLISPGVAYPYEKTKNLPFDNNVPGDWVLMTFPAYNVANGTMVYAIPDTANLDEYLKELPTGVARVMVGDGINYRVLKVGD
jgi:4-amino-4-deoxy-L-arabinose transferase-like glycosyltransferase